MLAIAAMSRNRVIGSGSCIPWRIPAELKFFRRMTLGCVVVMGRRTFESLPRPLDGRVNVVLTRHPRRLLNDETLRERYGDAVVRSSAYRSGEVTQLHLPKMPHAEVRLARDIDSLAQPDVKTWLCGGAQIYEQFLDRCSELYLSVLNREVEGDAYFPRFEHLFDLAGVVEEFPEFRVHRYVRNSVAASAHSHQTKRRVGPRASRLP
jgi:dihydrofolate reductase